LVARARHEGPRFARLLSGIQKPGYFEKCFTVVFYDFAVKTCTVCLDAPDPSVLLGSTLPKIFKQTSMLSYLFENKDIPFHKTGYSPNTLE
jgi:hypothetical protein